MILLTILTFSVCFADESVKYVAIIYRHGDRTPVDTYPTDPWRNESFWPVKFGELTNIGKMQHYSLGQWFRKRYSHLLSSEFDPAEIYVQSTDVDRTLMSAQANLAGMYPPTGKTIWNNALMWQPIPVHTIPERDDAVLAMKKNCVSYNKEKEKVVQSKAYKQRLSRYQKLMDYLTAYTGRKISDYYDIEDIYSSLHIESLYKFRLPNWTHLVFPNVMREPACYRAIEHILRELYYLNKYCVLSDKIKEYIMSDDAQINFTTSAATPLLARLRAGPLLKEIVTNMKHHVDKTKRLNMTMYSGHDFTIGTVLTALGVFDGNCPDYTSTITMELLYDNTTTPSIRISYRNTFEIVEPNILIIPYCGQTCPLERFMKLYENLLTVDFDYECGKQFPAVLGLSFFAGLVVFAIIYIAHKIHFARVMHNSSDNGRYTSVHMLQGSKVTHL